MQTRSGFNVDLSDTVQGSDTTMLLYVMKFVNKILE